MTVIDNRQVGDDFPCYITYEAGPTHSGLESAKRLVKYVADSGADAVKFQIFDPDLLVADRKQLFSYDVLLDAETNKTETVEESLYEILCRRCLTNDEWRELKKYSDSLNLAFFATVAFDSDITFLTELDCHSIKIASADVNHLPLLKNAAKTGMCIQLDTGNATLGEIETAVDVIRREGNEDIIIHQCPSGYPAHFESINLNIIKTLKQMFPYPVAFSDHTPGWDMDIAAVALGANLVEKTITEDRTTRSVEHIMSLEPSDMSAFITAIRNLEIALGTKRRILHADELEKRKMIRRSLYLTSPVKQGSLLSDAEIDFRRPGTGIPPDEYQNYLDASFNEDLPAGYQLGLSDLVFN